VGVVQPNGAGETDLPVLAASYAFGIAINHPFVDGNKRVAYVVCRTFLMLNGADVVASADEKYDTFLSLAAGSIDEEELVAWLRRCVVLR
jgi:death on curing protein